MDIKINKMMKLFIKLSFSSDLKQNLETNCKSLDFFQTKNRFYK